MRRSFKPANGAVMLLATAVSTPSAVKSVSSNLMARHLSSTDAGEPVPDLNRLTDLGKAGNLLLQRAPTLTHTAHPKGH